MSLGPAIPDSKGLVVFRTHRDSQCSDCGEAVPHGSLLFLREDKAFCLGCADLDHLDFLPRGDTALTRRARKHSGRVGRSTAAKSLDSEAEFLAVQAYARHRHADYDVLLMGGRDRTDARFEVQDSLTEVLDRWRETSASDATT